MSNLKITLFKGKKEVPRNLPKQGYFIADPKREITHVLIDAKTREKVKFGGQVKYREFTKAEAAARNAKINGTGMVWVQGGRPK